MTKAKAKSFGGETDEMAVNKKDDERNSLNSAIKIGKSEGTEETQKIMNMFDSIFFCDEECPDFIGMDQDGRTLFGIEHFRIDHFITEKRNHQIGATGVMYKKEIDKVRNTWKDEVLASQQVPDGAIKDIMSIMTNQLERKYSASYSNFIHSFKYATDKHIEHLDHYWERLELSKTADQTIKMSFLMEIYTDFHELYLNHYNCTEKNVSGLMPLFEDVVELLNQVPKDRVQYFILYLKNYEGSVSRVIALDNNDLMGSIRRQEIKVYKYAGMDYLLNPFETLHGKAEFEMAHEKRGELIDMNCRITTQSLNQETYQFLLFNATKLALEAKNMGKPFVCDSAPQRVLYVYGDHIMGWRKADNKEYVYEPIVRQMKWKTIQRRNNEYEEKFGVECEVELNE